MIIFCLSHSICIFFIFWRGPTFYIYNPSFSLSIIVCFFVPPCPCLLLGLLLSAASAACARPTAFDFYFVFRGPIFGCFCLVLDFLPFGRFCCFPSLFTGWAFSRFLTSCCRLLERAERPVRALPSDLSAVRFPYFRSFLLVGSAVVGSVMLMSVVLLLPLVCVFVRAFWVLLFCLLWFFLIALLVFPYLFVFGSFSSCCLSGLCVLLFSCLFHYLFI